MRTEQKENHKKFKQEKANAWKGDNIGYHTIHVWLKSLFGEPNKCENDNCVYPRKGTNGLLIKPKRYEYALIKDKKYERKRENFIMLCPSCHHKYDKIGERGWLTKRKNNGKN
jgi:hypothetical protein